MLEIILITYNRSAYLAETLKYLLNSKVSKYKITVLNNASTDDTITLCESFKDKFNNFSVISHKHNIGLGANIIRALEISSSVYTWVLCDDDFIDLSSFDDVESTLQKGEVDLVHVGGHPQKEWKFGGSTKKTKELYNEGYPYFKFSSFLPANIFKTKKMQESFLVSGYNNVVNAYPHMPYLFHIYESNSSIYVSQKQIVIAKVSGQSYDVSIWFYWWARTCELLSDAVDVRQAYLDQWLNIGENNIENAFRDFARVKKEAKDDYFVRFQEKYFNKDDIRIILKYDKFFQTRFERIRSIISNRLIALKELFIG